MRVRRAISAVTGVMLAMGAISGITAAPAQASPRTGASHDRIVDPNPVPYTPQVQNGAVKSIIKIGNRVFIGGSFTEVKQPGNQPVLTRNRLFAMNATTGVIDPTFNPNIGNGEVSVLLPAADGESLYVGGTFNSIGGQDRRKLTRINLTTGTPYPSFSPTVNGRVRDLRLADNRLYVGGDFTHVNGVARTALASVNPATGATTDFVNLGFAGTQTGEGTTLVYKMDITPDGSKLITVGNFNAVGDQTRNQLAMIDLSGDQATLSGWNTTRYAEQCSASFDTYMRDVDFSPDGRFFVVTTTGAYGTPPKLCDTHARWETAGNGPGQQPTWVNYTGGDTSYAVEITDTAVYAGGHFRWANNPFGRDRASEGAVERCGIAALDPANGLPFEWNPGRTRGVGVFDLLATSEGLWMGSDTDEAGGQWRPKLAMFPLAGGEQVPTNHTGRLPANVFSGGGTSLIAQNYLRHRSFNGDTAGAVTEDGTAGFDWRTARGAFMINGELYHGTSDGRFYRRTFNGSALGATTEIRTGDLLVNMSTWHSQVRNINGMFFADGRLYYTRGQSALYYRYFTPESNVVGAIEHTAVGNLTGVNWSQVGGMFVAAGKLYYVNNSDNGRLYSIAFDEGVPSGAPALVDSGDWRGRAFFLYSGTPNEDPVAAFSSNCDQLECAFDAGASNDPDGSIASYAWDFGDGANGTGASPEHTYTQAGTYTVKLTVTDNRGATAVKSQSITVSPTAASIGFRGGAAYNGNTRSASVNVPGAVQTGDGMLLFMTVNNASVTVTPPAGWTQVGTQSTGSAVSTVWRKVAGAGDAGQSVTVGLSDYAKIDLRLVSYEGTDAANPVATVAGTVDLGSVTDHVSPTAQVGGTGRWAVTYWGDKSSSVTDWTAPDGVAVRGTGAGSGSGRVTALVADTGGTTATGSYGGLTAETDAASRALMWTVVLARKS